MTDLLLSLPAESPWVTPCSVSLATVTGDDPIAEERAEAFPDAGDLQVYRAYSKGRQRLALTAEQVSILEGLLGHGFADNVYDLCLDINADRLFVTEFEVAPPPLTAGMGEAEAQAAADAVKEFIETLSVKAHFDKAQNKINKAVVRDGNHTVGLAWDEDTQRVVFLQQPFWDGECGMYVAYNENGLPAYAVKEWTAVERDTDTGYSGKSGVIAKFLGFVSGLLNLSAAGTEKTYRYRTLYFPDRIEKYRQDSGAGGKWEIHQPEGEPWPIPWLKRDGSGIGISVVHFDIGGDNYYGEPAAPMPVVANQNFLNDVRYDLAGVGRQTGFQCVVLSGFPAFAKDAEGKPIYSEPITYINGAGVFYVSEDPDSRGTVLEPGDPEGLIKIYNLTLESMSRQTQTPLFLLTVGGNTSGAAILRAEAPLAGKAKKQTESLGPAYATLIHRAIEIYNAKNKAGITINEDALISPVWADTSKPDAMAVIEFDKAKADLERAELVLEQEKKAVEEGRPILMPADETSRRLAAVLSAAEPDPAAA